MGDQRAFVDDRDMSKGQVGNERQEDMTVGDLKMVQRGSGHMVMKNFVGMGVEAVVDP